MITNKNTEAEEESKILLGLEKSFEKLLEFKKQKNSPLVIMRGNKIVKISAEDFIKDRASKMNNL